MLTATEKASPISADVQGPPVAAVRRRSFRAKVSQQLVSVMGEG